MILNILLHLMTFVDIRPRDFLDLDVTKTHYSERTQEIFSLPKEPRDFVFGPFLIGLNILSPDSFSIFWDILSLLPQRAESIFAQHLKMIFFKILMDGFFSFVWRYRNDWLLHNRFPFDFDIQYSVAISWRSSTSVQTIYSTWTWQKPTTANGPHEIFSLPKEKEPRDFVFGPF